MIIAFFVLVFEPGQRHSHDVREAQMESALKGIDGERLVRVSAGPVTLEGNLSIPTGAKAVVLFAHGSGSSRHSPRNPYGPPAMRPAGLATLPIHPPSAQEEAHGPDSP